jgi:hypothetical protein
LRRLLRAAVVLTVVGVVYGLGVATAVFLGFGDSAAFVELHNPHGYPIQAVEVSYSCGSRQITLTDSQPPKRSTIGYGLSLCGDGSYRIQVTHENGSLLNSKGAYVQPGYRMIETIEGNRIETTYGRLGR